MSTSTTDHPLTVLLCAFSRSSLGHVVRTVAAAERLQQAGHDVTLAVHPSAGHVPESAGIRWRAIDEIGPAPAWRGLDDPERLRAFVRTRLASPEYIERSLADELAAIDEVRPDVVVSDMRNTAGVAAAIRGLPSCSIHNVHLFHHPMHVVLPEVLLTLDTLGVLPEHAGQVLGQALLIPDLPVLEGLADLPAPMASLICGLVREVRHVGPLLRTVAHTEAGRRTGPEARRVDGRRRATVMLGGSGAGDHELERLIRAVADEHLHLDVVLPHREDHQEVRERLLPHAGTCTLRVIGYQDDVVALVRDSEVAVLHGGHASLLEGLSCGTPLVLVPHSDEQRRNARRAAELGVASVVAPDADDATVSSAVRTAMDSRRSGQGDRLAAALRDAGDGRAFVAAVEATTRMHRLSRPRTGPTVAA